MEIAQGMQYEASRRVWRHEDAGAPSLAELFIKPMSFTGPPTYVFA